MFHGFYEPEKDPARAVAWLYLCSNAVKLMEAMSVLFGQGANAISELSHLLYYPKVTIGFSHLAIRRNSQ